MCTTSVLLKNRISEGKYVLMLQFSVLSVLAVWNFSLFFCGLWWLWIVDRRRRCWFGKIGKNNKDHYGIQTCNLALVSVALLHFLRLFLFLFPSQINDMWHVCFQGLRLNCLILSIFLIIKTKQRNCLSLPRIVQQLSSNHCRCQHRPFFFARRPDPLPLRFVSLFLLFSI
jgi:hypothetical protein